MTFEEACEKAYAWFLEFGREGLTKAEDWGDCWYFWAGDPNLRVNLVGGPPPAVVMKKTGEIIRELDLCFRERDKRIVPGKQMEIPFRFMRKDGITEVEMQPFSLHLFVPEE